MKIILKFFAFLLLVTSCKRERLEVQKPNTPAHDKVVFNKELTLHPYSGDIHATNYIAAKNSQFLVLNSDYNTGNKPGYPGYFVTHTWFDENLNEIYKAGGFNYSGSFQSAIQENNNSLFYYFHSYYMANMGATKFLNADRIYSLHDCNFSGGVLFSQSDTVVSGTQPFFIDFFKITQKASIVFRYKDSVCCMDTFGNLKWKIPSAPLNLSALRDVCETASGDILLLGEKQSATTDRDFCVTRFDKNGNVIWQKLYGGAFYDEAQQLLYKSDLELYLLGHSNSFTGGGMHDAFLVQINADGDTLKQKTFGGAYHDGIQCGKFYMDNLLVTGYRDPDGSGKEQVFVTLLDKNLNVLQQTEAPFTSNHRPTSCALINHSFAVCGEGFVMRFTMPY